MRRELAACVLCCLGGASACAVEEPVSSESQELAPSDVESPDGSAEALPIGPEPTPEMIAASLSGDPEKMARAVPMDGSCNAPTTCRPQYGSCDDVWSAWQPCEGAHCGGGTSSCTHIIDTYPKPRVIRYPATTSTSQRYRVCHDEFGQHCTEWEHRANVLGCDVACCGAACDL
jgi:hypothetical protein